MLILANFANFGNFLLILAIFSNFGTNSTKTKIWEPNWKFYFENVCFKFCLLRKQYFLSQMFISKSKLRKKNLQLNFPKNFGNLICFLLTKLLPASDDFRRFFKVHKNFQSYDTPNTHHLPLTKQKTKTSFRKSSWSLNFSINLTFITFRNLYKSFKGGSLLKYTESIKWIKLFFFLIFNLNSNFSFLKHTFFVKQKWDKEGNYITKLLERNINYCVILSYIQNSNVY